MLESYHWQNITPTLTRNFFLCWRSDLNPVPHGGSAHQCSSKEEWNHCCADWNTMNNSMKWPLVRYILEIAPWTLHWWVGNITCPCFQINSVMSSMEKKKPWTKTEIMLITLQKCAINGIMHMNAKNKNKLKQNLNIVNMLYICLYWHINVIINNVIRPSSNVTPWLLYSCHFWKYGGNESKYIQYNIDFTHNITQHMIQIIVIQ